MINKISPTSQMDWRTLVYMREIYGYVHTLIMRDMSRGNDLAEIDGKAGLMDAMQALKGRAPDILDKAMRDRLNDILAQPEFYRPTRISWPLMEKLKQAISGIMPSHGGYDVSFSQTPEISAPLKYLVVSVGSNIGVGDEFLAARALGGRVSELESLQLYVSSRRPDIWKLVSKNIQHLAPPPFGAFEAIDNAPAHDRKRTGYLFLDFVDSDPFPDYVGPDGLAFVGKWIMGERRAEWQVPGRPGRIMVVPPRAAPQHRETELHYVTGKIVPGRAVHRVSRGAQGGASTRSGIFLQCLTSKNGLLLPPRFWAEVVAQSIQTLGQDHDVTLAPGPTPGTAQHVARQQAELATRIGSNRVKVLPNPVFGEIFNAVSKSAVLLGPDTFTSHFATCSGTAQVSIIQPQHIAWVPADAPVFFVESDAGAPEELAHILARRLAVALGLPGSEAAKEVRTDAETWTKTMQAAWSAAHSFAAHGARIDPQLLAEWSKALHEIYRRQIGWTEHVMGCRYNPRYPACLTFAPQAFSDSTNLGWASIRWLQALSLNEIDAALKLAARGR